MQSSNFIGDLIFYTSFMVCEAMLGQLDDKPVHEYGVQQKFVTGRVELL